MWLYRRGAGISRGNVDTSVNEKVFSRLAGGSPGREATGSECVTVRTGAGALLGLPHAILRTVNGGILVSKGEGRPVGRHRWSGPRVSRGMFFRNGSEGQLSLAAGPCFGGVTHRYQTARINFRTHGRWV